VELPVKEKVMLLGLWWSRGFLAHALQEFVYEKIVGRMSPRMFVPELMAPSETVLVTKDTKLLKPDVVVQVVTRMPVSAPITDAQDKISAMYVFTMWILTCGHSKNPKRSMPPNVES